MKTYLKILLTVTILLSGISTVVAESTQKKTPAMPMTEKFKDKNFAISPEAASYMRLQAKQLQNDVIAGVERPGSVKKTWTAPNGEVWNAQFLFSGMKLGDVLVGKNDDGTPHEFTIEEVPYYIVPYLLWKYNDEGVPMTQIVQYCIWPTVYMGKQFWDQSLLVQQPDGTYYVPESIRNYAIMDFEDFANGGKDFCKTFTETGEIYPMGNDSNTSVNTWLLVPTKQVGIKSFYDGQQAYTNPAEQSRLTINSYDSAEGAANITNQIYMEMSDTGATRTISNTYDGAIRLEGFNPTEYRPDMGELHIFNCGELSSEMLGNNDPYYPESEGDTWGPFKRFYAWGLGNYLQLNVKDNNAPFSDDNVSISFKDGLSQDQIVSDNVNYWYGGFYSKVDTQDPSNSTWTLQEPHFKQDNHNTPIIVPVANSFVRAGYDYTFSDFDGVVAWYHEFSYNPALPSKIVMGSKDGSGLFATDQYGNKLFMGTKGKVIYHYNPNRVGDVRELKAVGSLDNADADFSSRFKVLRNGTVLKDGDTVVVNPEVFKDDPNFEFGCFYTGDINVETVSGERAQLYCELEYVSPSGPEIKADYARYGSVILCYQNAVEGGSCLGNGDDRVAGHAVLTCKGSGPDNILKLMCDASGTSKEESITTRLHLRAMENGKEIPGSEFTVNVVFEVPTYEEKWFLIGHEYGWDNRMATGTEYLLHPTGNKDEYSIKVDRLSGAIKFREDGGLNHVLGGKFGNRLKVGEQFKCPAYNTLQTNIIIDGIIENAIITINSSEEWVRVDLDEKNGKHIPNDYESVFIIDEEHNILTEMLREEKTNTFVTDFEFKKNQVFYLKAGSNYYGSGDATNTFGISGNYKPDLYGSPYIASGGKSHIEFILEKNADEGILVATEYSDNTPKQHNLTITVNLEDEPVCNVATLKVDYGTDLSQYMFTSIEQVPSIYRSIIENALPEGRNDLTAYDFTLSGSSGFDIESPVMPNNDLTLTVTLTPKDFIATFVIDGEEFKKISTPYGKKIDAPTVEQREGFTFSGWTDMPELMPSDDITVNGSFTANKYNLTITVNLEDKPVCDVATLKVEYGTDLSPYMFKSVEDVPSIYRSIVEEALPEGRNNLAAYHFSISGPSGFDMESPAMPDNDLILTVTLTPKEFMATFKIDGDEFKRINAPYGKKIDAPAVEQREGYTFSGWTDMPKLMPAGNINIHGYFSRNGEVSLTLNYNGRFITVTTMPDDATLTLPQTGNVLSETGNTVIFDPLRPGKFRFTASADGLEDKTEEIDIKTYSTENLLVINEAGLASTAYDWNGGAVPQSEKIAVEGVINQMDIKYICDNDAMLADLDISKASIDSNSESIRFSGSASIIRIKMDGHIDADAFTGCSRLTSVMIDCSSDPVLNFNLPKNCLTYVRGASGEFAKNAKENVICGDDGAWSARSIALTDGECFLVSIPFKADMISFTKYFSLESGMYDCRGWESIVLPFRATWIVSEKGAVKPFEDTASNGLDFWLYSHDDNAWQKAAAIEAYTPYIISMPNNAVYDDMYNITGDVTFSADNANMEVTPENGSRRLRYTFESLPKGAGVLALNCEADDNGSYFGEVPGSAFIADSRDVKPFEAYMTSANGRRTVRISEGLTGIETLPLIGAADSGIAVRKVADIIYVDAARDTVVTVIDATGRVLRTDRVSAGETLEIRGLDPGIYIIAGTKVLM